MSEVQIVSTSGDLPSFADQNQFQLLSEFFKNEISTDIYVTLATENRPTLVKVIPTLSGRMISEKKLVVKISIVFEKGKPFTRYINWEQFTRTTHIQLTN